MESKIESRANAKPYAQLMNLTTGKTYNLMNEVEVIGRTYPALISLKEVDISRKHCLLLKKSDDLCELLPQGRGGTKLNSTLCPINESLVLKAADVIEINNHRFLFNYKSTQANQKMEIYLEETSTKSRAELREKFQICQNKDERSLNNLCIDFEKSIDNKNNVVEEMEMKCSETSKEEAQDMTSQLKLLKNQLDDKNNVVEEMEMRPETNKKEAQDMTNQWKLLKNQLDVKNNVAEEMEMRPETNKEEAQDMTNQLILLKNQLDDKNNVVEEMEMRPETNKEEARDMTSQLKFFKNQLDDHNNVAEEMEMRRETSKEEAEDLTSQLKLLKDQLDDKNNVAEEMEMRPETSKREAEELTSQLKLSKNQLDDHNNVIEEMEKRPETSKEEAEELASQLKLLEDQLAKQKKAFKKKLKVERVALREQLIGLKRSAEHFQNKCDKMEKKLKKIKTVSDEEKKELKKKLESSESEHKGMIESVERNLECGICNEMCIEVMQLNCGHLFCKFCINKWKEKKNECPMCRGKIKTVTANFTLANTIDNIVAYMPEEERKLREEMIKERKGSRRSSAAAAPSTSKAQATLPTAGPVTRLRSRNSEIDIFSWEEPVNRRQPQSRNRRHAMNSEVTVVNSITTIDLTNISNENTSNLYNNTGIIIL